MGPSTYMDLEYTTVVLLRIAILLEEMEEQRSGQQSHICSLLHFFTT